MLPCQTNHIHNYVYLISCLHEFYGRDLPSDTTYESDPELFTDVSSVHEDIPEPESQVFLAYVTMKKPLPPGNTVNSGFGAQMDIWPFFGQKLCKLFYEAKFGT